MIGRVLQSSGGTYRVRAGGREFDCSLRGRIKQVSGGSIAVGDRVSIEHLDDGSCRIDDVLPRTGVLSRKAIARRREQVMAANIDQLAIVVSSTRPEPDLYMLDRLLAVAELNDLDPFIVCNKADLGGLPEGLELYRTIGYEVLATSVKTGLGIEQFRSFLVGRTTVLAGSSGVGKSSLLNKLMPGLGLRVGDVGEKKGRGRHTTTAALLIPLDDDSYIADTPGIQHFVPTGVGVDTVGQAFREFRPLLRECRFADCRHRSEPGCTITDAVSDGTISQRRYDSYLAILAEAEVENAGG